MQDPANMPWEVILHDRAMKHESMTFQFQSIYPAELVSVVMCEMVVVVVVGGR